MLVLDLVNRPLVKLVRRIAQSCVCILGAKPPGFAKFGGGDADAVDLIEAGANTRALAVQAGNGQQDKALLIQAELVARLNERIRLDD